MTSILAKITADFHSGKSLDFTNAEAVLDALISETEQKPIADLLRAWNYKGITSDEIYSVAKILRRRMNRVNSKHNTFVDIVGTGASKSKTFNVSTAVAFVVAGADVPVAKHGNKAATSTSGSADVLAELGIDHGIDRDTAEENLHKINICFMFAPKYHRLSPTLAKVRRGLGFPTIFNCVGPLCNPASAPHQLIGVWDKELIPKMATALSRLGTKKSWIVHGKDGLDEISITGPTYVAEINGTNIREFQIEPSDYFLRSGSISDLSVTNPYESAQIIRRILRNEMADTSAESIVLINSMAALCLTGRAQTIKDSFALATRSIRDGHAMNKFEQLVSGTNRHKI